MRMELKAGHAPVNVRLQYQTKRIATIKGGEECDAFNPLGRKRRWEEKLTERKKSHRVTRTAEQHLRQKETGMIRDEGEKNQR